MYVRQPPRVPVAELGAVVTPPRSLDGCCAPCARGAGSCPQGGEDDLTFGEVLRGHAGMLVVLGIAGYFTWRSLR